MVADIIILVIFALFVFFGYRAGLLKMIISASSYFFAIVIAYFLCDVVAEILMKTPIYDSVYDAVGGNIVNSDATAFGLYADYVSGDIAAGITKLIMKVLAFIILLVTSKIFLALLTSIMNVFARVPVFKQFNATGGAIIGGIIGITILYVAMAVIFVCAPAMEGTSVTEHLNSSWIASFMCENNILIHLIG